MQKTVGHPAILYTIGTRTVETTFGRLFGAGAVGQDLGRNVPQVVPVGHKPLVSSIQCQHTIGPRTIDEKPVVRA